MSPFFLFERVEKRKTYEKRAGHMMETLERERITEMLNEREGVKISPFRPGDVVQLTMEVPENRRRLRLMRDMHSEEDVCTEDWGVRLR